MKNAELERLKKLNIERACILNEITTLAMVLINRVPKKTNDKVDDLTYYQAAAEFARDEARKIVEKYNSNTVKA